MKTLAELLPAIQEMDFEDKFIEEYRQSFKSIIKKETPESIEILLNESRETFFYFAPLYVGSLFENKRFQDIFDFLAEVDMYGQERSLDFFIGKLVKYFYLSLKQLQKPITQLYTILCSNKEYGNKYTIAVATNAILDYQLNSHIYEVIDEKIEDKEEKCRYLFYLGFIYLVRGDYKKALGLFDESDILNASRTLDLLIRKCTIICKLHLGDFSIFYPYQDQLKPYFALIGCVKRGDIKTFYSLLEDQQAEYFTVGLYFCVRRLLKIIAQVGLRKVAACYSRIKVCDISEIIGFNVECLLYKTIKDGEIKGFVQEGIFYSQQENFYRLQCGDQIHKAIEVRKHIQNMMKYPEIVPLTFEKVFESENK